jgi:uncharacterized protein YgiM (DUF1202 family)
MIFKVLIVVALNAFGWFTIYRIANPYIRFWTKSSVAVEQAVKHKVATVTSDALNMREQPSAGGALIRTLQKGARLTVSGDVQDGWVPVEIDGPAGLSAILMFQLLREQAAEDDQKAAAEKTAKVEKPLCDSKKLNFNA